MRKKLNLVGQRFGRLLVLEKAGRSKCRKILWKCKCVCGIEKIIFGAHLRNGNTKSCGCLNRERVSEANSGKNNSNYGKDFSGLNNPNYNPNITNEERQRGRFYPEYREWHKAIFERDNYTCQCCGRCGGNLVAHHLESYNNNPELRTLLENGIILCEECHRNFHHQYGYTCTRGQFEEFLKVERRTMRLWGMKKVKKE